MSYAEEYYPRDGFVIDAAADARAAFIRRTYLHLFGAIAAFIALEAALLTSPVADNLVALIGGNWWMALLAFMAVSWVAERWAHSDTSQGMQYLGLAVYTAAEAIIFVPLLWIAQLYDANLIPTAGILTFLIFGGLTVFVMSTGKDFSFMRNFLYLAGLAAMALIVASAFGLFSLGLIFTVAMILLMCGYILYHTSNVLHHYHTDQHVAASLALFASVATLFWYVLQLLMRMSDD